MSKIIPPVVRFENIPGLVSTKLVVTNLIH